MASLDIVIFPFTDKWWDWEASGFNYRTAELASRLSSHSAVSSMLVVDVPTGILRITGSRKSGGSRVRGGLRLTRVGDRVSVLDQTRLMSRERHNPVALGLNAILHDAALRTAVTSEIRSLSMRRVVAVHAGPLTLGHAGLIGEHVCVYDGRDEWLAHSSFARMRTPIARGYEQVRKKADIVLGVSEGVVERFRNGKARVEILPNGVSSEYEKVYTGPVPADIQHLPRPVVGYIGSIQERLDVGMIERLAEDMPHVSICLIGRILNPSRVAGLLSRPNVHALGQKGHADIRSYVSALDVCLMPHADTELVRKQDPLKLYEYAAAGKPTVCSGIPVHSRFDGFARVADNPRDFVDSVGSAVGGKWGILELDRLRFVSENSWDCRVDRMLDIVFDFLAEPSVPSICEGHRQAVFA